MEQLFKDKVALVTGAGSGIGAEIAKLYAAGGAKVIVSDVAEDHGKNIVAAIKEKGGEATFVKCDVSNPEECKALVDRTVSTYGRLDIACNNAGIGGELNPIADHSIEMYKKVIDINLNSVFYGMKYQLPAMLKNGGGAIVNISSILGLVGTANSPAYVAAKHGVIGLTKAAAIEYSAKGVRVNAVCPGYIDTPILDGLQPEVKAALVKLHPIGRLGKAEEVAEIVGWLSSDKASFVTGGFYTVDGAYTAQ
ncbi:NAD(P)-dependent dehydrogenase (short-subunit alcohol dehydrogenase family) [Chitinophaga terrae (ex Kim and Jung 2007)]|uniref:glucose 1-dehydrogenase n=1 Tax=Chitinophaga terrae (ex Kim and Jung 2007) TaxID=408074 RepID=UPI00277D8DF4|nr:glucose 1-dehydrogenase [Chitinophaga terrae (ex Kim and Jung 2007)]MDQ0106726.1 NAD(P)-dependent dehydrogenase (short-subunit alcohol dehydrogenase family) [Chitinophaga terrae (ex Kim and Jung 2007)]